MPQCWGRGEAGAECNRVAVLVFSVFPLIENRWNAYSFYVSVRQIQSCAKQAVRCSVKSICAWKSVFPVRTEPSEKHVKQHFSLCMQLSGCMRGDPF